MQQSQWTISAGEVRASRRQSKAFGMQALKLGALTANRTEHEEGQEACSVRDWFFLKVTDGHCESCTFFCIDFGMVLPENNVLSTIMALLLALWGHNSQQSPSFLPSRNLEFYDHHRRNVLVLRNLLG
jgi:hypothetical protein